MNTKHSPANVRKSEHASTDVAPAQDTHKRGRSRMRMLLRRSEKKISDRNGGGDSVAAELALLREENAYLRMKAAARPNVGRATAMISELDPSSPEGTADNDGWTILAESLVIRDTLIDACRELVAATSQLEHRLTSLALPANAGAAGQGPPPEPPIISAPPARFRDDAPEGVTEDGWNILVDSLMRTRVQRVGAASDATPSFT
ncbi:MAG: hypothetical protein WAO61_07520 [Solirubrobacterales bacterium]